MKADQIDYQIIGNDLQVLEITLDPEEGVRGEVGTMMFMADGINMQTKVGGGIFSGFKRILSGESFFISTFKNGGKAPAQVGFAAPYPGKIIALISPS